MAYLNVVTVLSVLLFVTYGDAIKCWTCSSDLDAHCGDTFNHTSPSFNLHHALTDCDTQSSPHFNFHKTKSVCKKIKQTVNGHMAVVRSCEWLRPGQDTVGDCASDTFTTPSYIKIQYCGTCEGDACNGSEGQYVAAVWKALIPAAIALLLRY